MRSADGADFGLNQSKAWNALAVHFDLFTEHAQRPYPQAKLAVQRLVDDHLFLALGAVPVVARGEGQGARVGARGALGAVLLLVHPLTEHLGREESEVADSFARTGSLLATIAELTHAGRRLEPLPFEKPEGVAKTIAETELLDPKSPDAMFERMTERSLFRPFRGRLKALRHRGKQVPA